jgi:DNA (cytosine-5)-methyltransferase 1
MLAIVFSLRLPIMVLMTVHQVAEKLQIHSDTVRRWSKQGLIKSHRNELNHRVFDLTEVRRIAAKTLGESSGPNRFKILKRRKLSGYNVIDLFAGAGGTALGLRNAGLSHEILVELNRDAAETLTRNMPRATVMNEDVSGIDFRKYRDSVDIVEAGFPCQAFSYAGTKNGFDDTRGTLFFEFARSVNEIRPKIAIAENVRGLISHDGGRTLRTMIRTLDEIGYNVTYKLLRSQYLDVPQKRERLIILAVRKDLELPFLYPIEKDYTISLAEALEGVPDSEGQAYSEKKLRILDMVPEGGYWRNLPVEVQKEYMGASFYLGGGKTGMARRLSWSEPSLTIVCSPAQKQTERCHPSETRPLTVRESARIQTFPDSWEFAGSVSSQYKQIGNAVPVNLGFHVGEAAICMLNGTWDEQKFSIEPRKDPESQLQFEIETIK